MPLKAARTRALAAAVTASAALTLVAVAPAPAGAAMPATANTAPATPTVWVDAKVNQLWPVRRAVAFVDRYTGTKLRLGKCRQGAECIVIREKWNMDGGVAGLTYVGGGRTTPIQLNARNGGWMTWGQRYHTVIHELGHARGIYTHDHRCTSVMYESTNCNRGTGRLTPRAFTAVEKKILRNH